MKFLVPKKYCLNIIINDSVKSQKELLEGKLLFIMKGYMVKTTKHITCYSYFSSNFGSQKNRVQ